MNIKLIKGDTLPLDNDFLEMFMNTIGTPVFDYFLSEDNHKKHFSLVIGDKIGLVLLRPSKTKGMNTPTYITQEILERKLGKKLGRYTLTTILCYFKGYFRTNFLDLIDIYIYYKHGQKKVGFYVYDKDTRKVKKHLIYTIEED